ncbi:MAG: alpha-amylase/4-alpha-glucanotransferase domain-containing protein [Pseudomonadota bacterium]
MGALKVIFVVHNHQPTGNYDRIMRMAHDDCYLPFVEALERHPDIRAGLHYTGPLLEWMENNVPETIGRIAQLAASGQVEILGGGWQEPMLSNIPLRDAVGQMRMMKRECARLFGAVPRGMWLAERVWEPGLAQVIGRAGYAYTLLDDTHFRFAGLLQQHISGYYVTEKRGQPLFIFPISKALRYAIPFKEPEEIVKTLSQEPGGVWTYGDDGEKFGLWPGTRKWVWEKGWMERFMTRMQEEAGRGTLSFALPSSVIREHRPEGRIHLPTCSYHEMGEWSLPAEAGKKLQELLQKIKEAGLEESAAPFIRGGIWSNFLTKYPESNQLHKKMMHVSRKVADREKSDRVGLGSPSGDMLLARRSLYRGQTNCGYWHGLFGGLYLPHLRKALWKNLIEAEKLVDPLNGRARVSRLDFNCSGREDILIEGELLTALISPENCACLQEIDVRARGFNLVDVLTRRKEIYHDEILTAPSREEEDDRQAHSIHDLKRYASREIKEKLKIDAAPRHAFQEFILQKGVSLEDVSGGREDEGGRLLLDLRALPMRIAQIKTEESSVMARAGLTQDIPPARLSVEKTYYIDPVKGTISVHFALKWDGNQPLEGTFVSQINFAMPELFRSSHCWTKVDPPRTMNEGENSLFSAALLEGISKISCAGPIGEDGGIELSFQCSPICNLMRYPIETVSQSETDFEAVCQGTCLLVGWEIHLENWNEWKASILLKIRDE